MIRIKNRKLPNENLMAFISRLVQIENWCKENLEDHEWDIVDINMLSVKNNGSILQFSAFEFSDPRIVSLVALKFGL